MDKKKRSMRNSRMASWILISCYLIFIAGYFGGRKLGSTMEMEYRFWVDVVYRILVWFVPILFVGITILVACVKLWKKKSMGRWILAVVLVFYGCAAAYLSFLYVLIGAFTLTMDEKMPDGNLVVAVPNGMESSHHYAEPVGFFFRRKITFDEVRTAESLSKIYGVSFRPKKRENGEWTYISEAYPGIEVTNIRHGFTETSYLDNDFHLALTSKMLQEHRKIFSAYDVELVSYAYGQTQENPDGWGPYTSVLVSEEKKEDVAASVAEFIKVTLQEDLRTDGRSCWDCVDGSIFFVIISEEGDGYESIRNIPFSLKPEYSWVYDAAVTADVIAGDIVIKNKSDIETGEAESGKTEANIQNSEEAEGNTETEEFSQEVLDYYLSIEPACVFVTEDGMEYRMIPVDRALGSSFYVLIGTKDQGKTCAFVNPDPYNGSGGEARWIIFLDTKTGFSCLSHSGGSYGSLYRTEDAGVSWKEMEYPSANAKLPDGTVYNPFVMPEKIYEERDVLYMEVGQGADGDYYDESGFCHGLYRSFDGGVSWEYLKTIPAVRT